MGGETSSNTMSNNTSKTGYTAAINQATPYSYTNITPTRDFFGNTIAVNSSQGFVPGTLYAQTYDKGNQDFQGLYDEWKNPSLDSATNQARIAAYNKEMGKNYNSLLQNDIINPLVNSNMLRSSQATNMYNNAANQLADKYNDFTTDLLASSEENAYNRLKALYEAYAQGQAALAGDYNSAIQMANGNQSTISSGNTSSGAK